MLLLCRFLVQAARALGLEVIDRCNLTVLTEPGQEDLAAFLAENKVKVSFSISRTRPDEPVLLNAHCDGSCLMCALRWFLLDVFIAMVLA